jgi:hypothetical protein
LASSAHTLSGAVTYSTSSTASIDPLTVVPPTNSLLPTPPTIVRGARGEYGAEIAGPAPFGPALRRTVQASERFFTVDVLICLSAL